MNFTAVIVVDAGPSSGGPGRGAGVVRALAQVANRPILHHALDGLSAARVNRLIVAGDADALIDVRACVRDYEPRLDSIDYAVCREGTGLASQLSAVAPLVGEAPCLMQPADGLLEAPVLSLTGLLDEQASDLVLFSRTDDADDEDSEWYSPYGTAPLTASHRNDIADLGVFAPGALLRANEMTKRLGQIDLATAGQRLAADGAHVRVESIGGWCRYQGQKRELLELNRLALDRLVASVPAQSYRSNRLEGRVSIHPTASIRDSVIIGPTVIGPGATLNEAYIGPYTSIGSGARIEGAEIERSIVSSGASVMHVGGRLVSSLVGRDARVFRDFSLPRALRLWVGDGDEVALC